jgi:hypothetical protein
MCRLLSSMTVNGFAAQLFYEVFGSLWNRGQGRQFGAVFAIKNRTELEIESFENKCSAGASTQKT